MNNNQNTTPRICTVYGLCRSDSSAIRYVGQTGVTPDERLKRHIHWARRGATHAGRDQWIVNTIAEGATVVIVVLEQPAIWNTSEQQWIARLRTDGSDLLNKTVGGSGGMYSGPRGPRNGNAKLTEDDVRFIKSSGLSARTLMKRFQVGSTTICNIRSGKLWPHIVVDHPSTPDKFPLRIFFDGTDPLPAATELRQAYENGASHDALAKRFGTARDSIMRALKQLGVQLRNERAAKKVTVNGHEYHGVLAAMRGEKVGYKELMRLISGESKPEKVRVEPSAEYRAMRSEIAKRTWADPAIRQKRIEGTRAGRTPEVRKRLSEATTAQMADPAARQRLKEIHKERAADPAVRAAKSEATKRQWADPVTRAVMIQSLNGVPKTKRTPS